MKNNFQNATIKQQKLVHVQFVLLISDREDGCPPYPIVGAGFKPARRLPHLRRNFIRMDHPDATHHPSKGGE